MTDHDPDLLRAKATALRLLLAQIDRNTDALDNIEREIEPDLLERPDDMTRVLGTLLGIAAAEVVHRHHNDKAAAAKTIETALAQTLDDLA
ncbi:hypothetical protein JRC04_27060 [Mycolicibacterium sp. S2-37]|uniref:hypothetical protein n=1 Tax=Mycolicibacterium sp. S2-37 TaxID=2810297 RepID=UPI001A94775D|nr:hypothetical protein [Mycolicibacterium sp. S2-37]MBO0681141.1 hypothetical protein [Mycolicibacterium sp. S2-37]